MKNTKKIISALLVVTTLCSFCFVSSAGPTQTDNFINIALVRTEVDFYDVLPDIIEIVQNNPNSLESQDAEIEAFFEDNCFMLSSAVTANTALAYGNQSSVQFEATKEASTGKIVYEEDFKIEYFENQGVFQITQLIESEENSVMSSNDSIAPLSGGVSTMSGYPYGKYSSYITRAAYNVFGTQLWHAQMRGYFLYSGTSNGSVNASHSGTTYSLVSGLFYFWSAYWNPYKSDYVLGSNRVVLDARFSWSLFPLIAHDVTRLNWSINCTPTGVLTYNY